MICLAKGFYTYDAFVQVARNFTGFGTTGSITDRKRVVAAFLAQTSHATTGGWPAPPDGPYTWGYCFKIERGNPDSRCKHGRALPARNIMDEAPSKFHKADPGFKFYGNYNYGPCGVAIGEDLLRNTDLVAADRVISFKTALWVWMTSTSKPQMPSCHDVILGKWKPSPSDIAANRLPGYGVITNILNGGSECGHGSDPRVEDRIGFYLRYCKILGVSPGENLDCGNQKPFGHLNSIYVE
ncbi:basic 30 kda endochitinase [Nicotiana attenuata]|uniref:Basic 30 kDa endochitinase n=1 Tax=Nicotiana attenuata TaxID=49451 RepID=A0A1J6IJG1_NICAT|nr:basic 30 kda endochitinase [Nicotiana attenuata]